jgi:hypothetical protein
MKHPQSLLMTWTAPAVDRGDFPGSGDERARLETFLDFHRNTLLLKCSGLNGEQLGSKPLQSTSLTPARSGAPPRRG